jgi:hypothetical protein
MDGVRYRPTTACEASKESAAVGGTCLPLSGWDHRLAILVNQGSDGDNTPKTCGNGQRNRGLVTVGTHAQSGPGPSGCRRCGLLERWEDRCR